MRAVLANVRNQQRERVSMPTECEREQERGCERKRPTIYFTFINMRAKYLYKLITHFLVLLSSPPFLYSPWQMNYAAPAKLFIYYLSIDFRGMPNLIRRQSHTNTHLSTHIHRPTLAHTYTRTRVFVLFLFAAFFLSICDLFSQPQI